MSLMRVSDRTSAPVPPIPDPLTDAGRALSASTLLFHQLVALHLQLNDTDHRCLDLLLREGDMTAGDLSARSGFTTGAITGIVDRLAARGLVRRTRDPEDRRRVLVHARREDVEARMRPLLEPMVERMAALHRRYPAAEQEVLLDYLRRCEAIVRESAVDLAARRGR